MEAATRRERLDGGRAVTHDTALLGWADEAARHGKEWIAEAVDRTTPEHAQADALVAIAHTLQALYLLERAKLGKVLEPVL
jgi:hypothetical protein